MYFLMSMSILHIACLWTERRKDKDRPTRIKLKDSECNMCKKAVKAL